MPKLNRSTADMFDDGVMEEIPPHTRPDMSRRFRDPKRIVPNKTWDLAKSTVCATKIKLLSSELEVLQRDWHEPTPKRTFEAHEEWRELEERHNQRVERRINTIKAEQKEKRRRARSVILKGQKMLKVHDMPEYLTLVTKLLESGVKLRETTMAK